MLAICRILAPKSNRYAPQVDTSVNLPPAKKKRLARDAFLNEDEEEDEEEDEIVVEKYTEVDQYLLLPQLSESMSFDLLAWWKNHSTMWPNLTKMARQYLALPATSDGVERLLSNGGKMHTSPRGSTKNKC